MKRKMILAFAGLFIALSLVGATYAAWWDVIVIEGTANTGEFAVGILDAYWLETTNGYMEYDPNWPIGLDYIPEWVTGPFEPKPWVASTVVTLYDDELVECVCEDQDPIMIYHGMDILIENAYPQYDAHIIFNYKNAGTIPAQFVGSEMYGLEVDAAGDWVYDGEYWVWHGWLLNPDDTYAAEIYAMFEGPEDGQLEPCNTMNGQIHIKFLQTAWECEIYEFGVMFKFVQWNKWYEEPELPWPEFPAPPA
jgi:hypothetical protein